MSKILDGKIVRDKVVLDLSQKIGRLDRKPCLAIIQIGNDPASEAYIHQKKLFGEKVGAKVNHIKFSSEISEKDVIDKISALNRDADTHGIIVQLPIPEDLDKYKIIEAIDSGKDVDGLTAKNLKLLWEKKRGILPATARGVVALLDYYDIAISGKKIVVIGRSSLVGKPLFLALLNRDATVTLCHSHTSNLAEITTQADIVISAIGQPEFLKKHYFSSGQIVIDVGMNIFSGGHLEEEVPKKKFTGDVDFEQVSSIVQAISPVPGGVGPMTVASLFENLFEAFEQNIGK